MTRVRETRRVVTDTYLAYVNERRNSVVIPILIVSPRRDRELSKLRRYRRNDRVVERPSYSGLGISSRAARREPRVSRSDRPPGISAISPNRRSRQRNTTLGLLPRAHRVHRRHHLRRIHNFARSLPNRLLARSPFLLLSRSLPCSRVSGASRSSLGARRHRFRYPTSQPGSTS